MDRDIDPFESWARTYDRSRLQARYFRPVQREVLHHAELVAPRPGSILDIGCGTASLLRQARLRFPAAVLTGVDPAQAMVRGARDAAAEGVRERFVQGRVEQLPFSDASFDLVLSTLSFHHWADQRRGLAEIARVLTADGHVVIADHFATGWLRPFFAAARKRDRMHTHREVDLMLARAGLLRIGWHIAHTVAPFLLGPGPGRGGRPLLPLAALCTARNGAHRAAPDSRPI